MAELYKEKANDFLWKMKWKEALSELEQCLAYNPGDFQAMTQYAFALVMTGRYDNALKQYKSLLDLHRDSYDIRYGLGFCLFRTKNYASALEEFNLASSMDQNKSGAIEGIGRCHFETGNFEKALEYLRKAISMDYPARKTPLEYAAKSCYELGNYDEGAKYAQELINADESAREPYIILAKCLADSGNLREAIEVLDKVIFMFPSFAEAHDLRKEVGDRFDNSAGLPLQEEHTLPASAPETPQQNVPSSQINNQNSTVISGQQFRRSFQPPSQESNPVGLIGDVAAGKSTMFAYFLHFLRETAGKFDVNFEVDEGQEYYMTFLDDILSNKRFPNATGMEAPNRILIKFHSQGRIRKRETDIEINDMAGELFLRTSQNSQRKGEAYRYLSKCSSYLFIIDCSIYSRWTSEDLVYSGILRDLFRLIGGRKKTESPIAFVFTKSDLLPEAIFHTSPVDLLKSITNTFSFVDSHFTNYSAFKTFIKTERDESGDMIPVVDTLAGGRLDIIYDATVNYGFQQISDWLLTNAGIIKSQI